MKMTAKDRYNLNRRKKYKSDPEYADRVKQRVQEHRAMLKKARKKMNAAVLRSFVSRWRQSGVHEGDIARRLDYLGSKVRPPLVKKFGNNHVRLYPVTVVAAEIGFSVSTIRKWEREGAIPGAVYRDKSNRRWYSEFFMDLLAEAISETEKSTWGIRKLKTEVEKLWQKHVGQHPSEANLLAQRSPRPRLRKKKPQTRR